ncbi:TonB C-terminal domain-containing protein [Nitratifractor sp.]|uniref:TonB C-terminal domain-containing protein n=1 Tax=Nitratifractor sp. TaxID=2268144 RepID=UPI0025D71775|nr:TonB C-terminal domain-containing protein [Nitratifractor sp.]
MRDKIFAGIAAVIIYLSVIGLILYYFGFHRSEKSTHFVAKNRKGIAVSLAGSPHPPKPAAKSPVKKRRHPKPRNIAAPQKNRAHRPARKSTKARKPDTKKLFSHVKVPPRKAAKTRPHTGSAGEKKAGAKTLKKSRNEGGVENAYLAKVENLLKGWPAQANFAGEEIDIRLKIYPDGRFDYRILRLSGNPDFNHALINYLKQLQQFGFGPHSHGKPYDIEVKFIAHQ